MEKELKEKPQDIYRQNHLSYLYKFIKIVLILIPVLILIWLLKENIFVGDNLRYYNDFSKKSPFISDFFPQGRAELKNDIWRINLEPIYFDVYYPGKFQSATVKIIYKNTGGQMIRMGIRKPGEWNYEFKTLEENKNGFVFAQGWREKEMNFDLENVLVEKNKLRFIISSPNLETNQNEILVKSLGVVLKK